MGKNRYNSCFSRVSMRIFIYILLFFVTNTVCKHLTGDFSENKLLTPSSANSSWSQIEGNQIDLSTFDQKYRYLGKGKQAHVFISEDGEHVLKLFRQFSPLISINFFGKSVILSISKIPFASFLFSFFWQKEGIEKRQLDFISYVNSFNLLKKETRLEYLHLAKTDCLKRKIHLYDKIGVLHQIDLDSTCFLVQKKTDLLYPTLTSLLKQKKEEEAKKLLEKFALLCLQLTKKGIINPTTIEQNYGYLQGDPILIDVGRVLTKDDLQQEVKPPIEQIYHTAHHMKKWLQIKDPLLCQYFEKILTTYANENAL